jgi:hypothetical protein
VKISATPCVIDWDVRASPPESRVHQERFAAEGAASAVSSAGAAGAALPPPSIREKNPPFFDSSEFTPILQPEAYDYRSQPERASRAAS